MAKIQHLEAQIVKLTFEKNRSVTQKEKVFQTLFDDQESRLRSKDEKVVDVTAQYELSKIEAENAQESIGEL